MNLQEINNELNASVQVLVGQKLEYREIHEEVREIIKGLKNGFSYRVWEVNHKSKQGLDIFSIQLETLDDARSKHKRMGKIQSINFKLNFPEFAELTITELFRHCEIQEKLQNIEYIKETILKREQEIEELKKYLVEAENDLSKFL